VPVNDGRKITLVLFGGIMCGIRGIGALVALEELGLKNVFDSVYVISAGLPNISYFLDNKIRLAASVYYDDLSGRKFINPFRIWKIVETDYLMYLFQNTEKRIGPSSILSLSTRVYVGMQNIETKKIEYIEVHEINQDQYFSLLRAGVSVPFLHPGSTTLHGKRYKDVGRSFTNSRASIHVRTAWESDATDILFIYNRFDQYRKRFAPSDRTFEILPPKNALGLFETRTDVLKSAAQEMGDLVKMTFGVDEPIRLK